MKQFQYLLNTGGYCFLCQKIKESNDSQIQLEHNVISYNNVSGTGTTSFRNICKYLKTNLGEVLGEASPESSSALSVFEQSDIKGTLCAECSQHFETFSRTFLELEVVKIKLERCIRSIHKVLADDVDVQHSQGLEKFKEEMMKRPETLVQYGIVERLRKDILLQSSLLIEKRVPRVALERLPKASLNQLVSKADPPSLIPSILSVHGTLPSLQNDINFHSGSPDVNNDAPVPVSLLQSNAIKTEFVLLECDLCHLKVSDLSTHLYTDHFELEDTTCMEAEAEPMDCDTDPLSIENLPCPTINLVGREEPSLTNPDADCDKPNEDTRNSEPGSSLIDTLDIDWNIKSAQPSWEFKCYICQASFKEKTMLTEHQQKDHYRRRHKCQFCFDWFTNYSTKWQHEKTDCPVKKMRGFRVDKEDTASTFTLATLHECDICHKNFISLQARSRHHDEDHQGDQYGCDLCHGTFPIKEYKSHHKCPAQNVEGSESSNQDV